MGKRILSFLAIILTSLALVPVGAHILELPNKIAMTQADYFVVQGIYAGWALLGIILFLAIAANLALAIRLRRQSGPFRWALAGALLVAATLAVFFVWTYPANQATVNWTSVPANWVELRGNWEFGHAVNAVLTFLALCAVTIASLGARD